MLVHLMTGKFFVDKKQKFKTSFYYDLNSNKDQKHDRVIFFHNSQKLIYNDIRKLVYKVLNIQEVQFNSHLKI